MTKLEQVLNRVQRELGGQVGSFRLKGIRHRFTGRSSLVAFADGMWGGEFALKFYSDVEAAQTEFAIYRQAEVRMQQHSQRGCVCVCVRDRRPKGIRSLLGAHRKHNCMHTITAFVCV